MTDPFRDGMEAALERTDALEDENEMLREELERLRRSAMELRENANALHTQHSDAQTRALATKAIDVLDQLEVVSQRPQRIRVSPGASFTGVERPLTAVAPEAKGADASAADDVAALRLTAPKKPAVQPSPPSPPNLAVWVLFASVLFFLLGFGLGLGMPRP